MITARKIESLSNYWDNKKQELLNMYTSEYIIISREKKKREPTHLYFKTREELLKSRPNLSDSAILPDFILIDVVYEKNTDNPKREVIDFQEGLERFAGLGLEGRAV